MIRRRELSWHNHHVARRSPRYRAQFAVTVEALHGGQRLACQTRDISADGLALDSIANLEVGTRVTVSVAATPWGDALEMAAEIARTKPGQTTTLGVRLLAPPEEWQRLIRKRQRAGTSPPNRQRRIRVLVLGNDQRQRGAMALYVTSGWDVLFACDEASARDAASAGTIHAVVFEIDEAAPDAWLPIHDIVARLLPHAKRLARGPRQAAGAVAGQPLIHGFVDRDAGLPALVEAVTLGPP